MDSLLLPYWSLLSLLLIGVKGRTQLKIALVNSEQALMEKYIQLAEEKISTLSYKEALYELNELGEREEFGNI